MCTFASFTSFTPFYSGLFPGKVLMFFTLFTFSLFAIYVLKTKQKCKVKVLLFLCFVEPKFDLFSCINVLIKSLPRHVCGNYSDDISNLCKFIVSNSLVLFSSVKRLFVCVVTDIIKSDRGHVF